MSTFSLIISKNKFGRFQIKIVFNKTILKDYFEVLKSLRLLIIIKETWLKVGKQRNMIKNNLQRFSVLTS